MNWHQFLKIVFWLYLIYSTVSLTYRSIALFSTSPKLAFIRSKQWNFIMRYVEKRLRNNPYAYPVMVYMTFDEDAKEIYVAHGYSAFTKACANAAAMQIANAAAMQIDSLINERKRGSEFLDPDEEAFIDNWEKAEKTQANPKLN